jgi:hypothetical protein
VHILRNFVVAAAALILPGFAVAQAQVLTQDERTIVLNGHAGKAAVLQSNGQSYVNLESLAQIAGGSLSFKDNQITLTIPGNGAGESGGQAHGSPAADALSREFMRAGVEAISTMREWRSTLAAAVQNSFSVNGTWVNDYQAKASAALRLAAVAASPPADHNALQYLQAEFDNLQAWSNGVVAGRQNLNAELAVRPAAIDNDPQYQRIVACSRYLGRMLVSGSFQGDPACH